MVGRGWRLAAVGARIRRVREVAGREGGARSVGVKMLLVIGAFAVSIVSYRFFEGPIRRARWNRPLGAMLVPASVGAVVVVTMLTLSSISARTLGAGAAVAAPKVTELRYTDAVVETRSLPAVIAAVKAARRGAKIPSDLNPPLSQLLKAHYALPAGCHPVHDSQTTSHICRLGDTAGAKSIVLIGDSHAQMWMPAILPMAQRDGWVVIPLVKSGCVPAAWTGSGYPGTSAATLRYCHAWYRWAVQKAKALHPDVTLAAGCCSGAAGSTADATKAAYMSLASSLKQASKSVILIADKAGIDKQPVDCLLAKHATMKTCTVTKTADNYALNDDLAVIARKRGIGFLKTRGWFCYQFQCPMVVGHTVVYRDTGHITSVYAQELTSTFRAAFRRCLFDTCPV